jgi:ribonuclease-3 family protein
LEGQERDYLYMNTGVLAFMGDAVYEMYVRQRLVERGQIQGDKLHFQAVKYVRAESQAEVMKALIEDLSEEELALIKRARNKKINTKPKNVQPMIYKWATAFEALIGYLYLSGQKGRLEEFMLRAFEKGGCGQ